MGVAALTKLEKALAPAQTRQNDTVTTDELIKNS